MDGMAKGQAGQVRFGLAGCYVKASQGKNKRLSPSAEGMAAGQ